MCLQQCTADWKHALGCQKCSQGGLPFLAGLLQSLVFLQISCSFLITSNYKSNSLICRRCNWTNKCLRCASTWKIVLGLLVMFSPCCHFICPKTLEVMANKYNVFSLFQSHASRLMQIDIYACFLKVIHDSIWSSVHALSLWKSIIANMWPGMDFSIKKSIRFDLPNTVKHFKPLVHSNALYYSCPSIDVLLFLIMKDFEGLILCLLTCH